MAQAAVSAGTITCSVVIPTRDRPEALARCLQALQGQSHSPLQIVVVDSAPEHSRAYDIAARFGARYVFEPKMGASRARNRGARECTGEVIAYLDDDCEPQMDWLKAIADEFADPHVAVVTGRIRPTEIDGATEQQDSIGLLDCGPGYRKLDADTRDWFELVNFGALSGGGNMAIRRTAFERLGGFDERLGRGAPQDGNEEPRAYLELIDRGYCAVYTPNAVVEHPLPAGTELRTRLLRDMRWSAAYLTLLVVEHAQHRRAALRYAWQSLLGRRRAWRAQPGEDRRRIASTPRVMLEWAKGPFLYMRMRWLTRSKPDATGWKAMLNRVAGDLRLAWRLLRAGASVRAIAAYPLRRRMSDRRHQIEFRGGASIVSPHDEPIAPMIHRIWGQKVYVPPGLALVAGDTVIDIGANVGVFTVWAARHAGVKVIAMEPSPRICEFLRNNVQRSGLKNVVVVEAACSACNGESTLYTHQYETNNSLYPQDVFGNAYQPRYAIRTLTLETVFAEHGVDRCALLKLNCEGAEYDIVLQSPPEAMAKVEAIAMEYHRGRTDAAPERLATALREAGFQVVLEPLHDQEGGYLYATRKADA